MKKALIFVAVVLALCGAAVLCRSLWFDGAAVDGASCTAGGASCTFLREKRARYPEKAPKMALKSHIVHEKGPKTCTIHETIEDQGLTREYHLYLPATLKRNAPLVFVLHGYRGDASKMKPQEFQTLAEEYGWAVCYPQGSKDSRGKNCWNVGYPWQIDTMAVDDCAFLCNLADYLCRKHHLSRKNTFLTGMSNGGEMCYLMAYRFPKEFGAIASMAGLTLVDMTERYEYTTPVPFMEVHGTADKTSLWEGDLENQYGWGAYLPVEQAVGAIVRLNGCDKVEVFEIPSNSDHRIVVQKYYSDDQVGVDAQRTTNRSARCTHPMVYLYKVEGGGHNWAMDSFDSPLVIFEFFKENLR